MRDAVSLYLGTKRPAIDKGQSQVFVGHESWKVRDVQQGLVQIWMGTRPRCLVLRIVWIHGSAFGRALSLEDCRLDVGR